MEVLFFHCAGGDDGAVNNGVVSSGNGTVADAIADGGDGAGDGGTVVVGGDGAGGGTVAIGGDGAGNNAPVSRENKRVAHLIGGADDGVEFGRLRRIFCSGYRIKSGMEVSFFHAAGVGDCAVNDGVVGSGDATADGGDGADDDGGDGAGGGTVVVGGIVAGNNAPYRT